MISALKSVARWWDPGKPIRTLLHEARGQLPGDTPNPIIDENTDELRLKHFEEFIEHTEYELALDTLIYIADACEEDGQNVPAGFWTNILKASEMMKLKDQAETSRSRFERANKAAHRTG